MTREEAISCIKQIKYRGYLRGTNPFYEQDTEAIEMAIKALSQEPCEDAVSRGELLSRVLCEGISCNECSFNEIDGVSGCLLEKRVFELPPVTQKPKYWIDKDNKIYKMPDDIPTMTIQYPTITHGDTISRTEVMKVISDFVTFEKYIDKHNHITFEPLEKMINALPSVTQKSGKWILLDECANSGYYCSRCQKKLVKEGWSDTVKKIKFCPNCGCRMVEPQESEVRNEQARF